MLNLLTAAAVKPVETTARERGVKNANFLTN